MALTQNIGGSGTLFVGEDKVFRFECYDPVTGLPIDMTGWTLLFDVRKNDKAPAAIFSKTPSLIGVFSGVSRAANTQRAVATLTDTELNTVKARTYRYSWKRMDDGVETVLVRGNFAPEKATAP